MLGKQIVRILTTLVALAAIGLTLGFLLDAFADRDAPEELRAFTASYQVPRIVTETGNTGYDRLIWGERYETLTYRSTPHADTVLHVVQREVADERLDEVLDLIDDIRDIELRSLALGYVVKTLSPESATPQLSWEDAYPPMSPGPRNPNPVPAILPPDVPDEIPDAGQDGQLSSKGLVLSSEQKRLFVEYGEDLRNVGVHVRKLPDAYARASQLMVLDRKFEELDAVWKSAAKVDKSLLANARKEEREHRRLAIDSIRQGQRSQDGVWTWLVAQFKLLVKGGIGCLALGAGAVIVAFVKRQLVRMFNLKDVAKDLEISLPNDSKDSQAGVQSVAPEPSPDNQKDEGG